MHSFVSVNTNRDHSALLTTTAGLAQGLTGFSHVRDQLLYGCVITVRGLAQLLYDARRLLT